MRRYLPLSGELLRLEQWRVTLIPIVPRVRDGYFVAQIINDCPPYVLDVMAKSTAQLEAAYRS